MFYNFNMLQYRLKYETVRTQMPFQNNNFLFNLFSLLSIFNSTFSLSLTHVLSLFLLQITLPHPQINGTAASPINGTPSRLCLTFSLPFRHADLGFVGLCQW